MQITLTNSAALGVYEMHDCACKCLVFSVGIARPDRYSHSISECTEILLLETTLYVCKNFVFHAKFIVFVTQICRYSLCTWQARYPEGIVPELMGHQGNCKY